MKKLTYLVIAKAQFGGVWGRGKSEAEAMRRAREQTGSKIRTYTVWTSTDPNAGLDGMGIIWSESGATVEKVKKVVDGKIVPLDAEKRE